MPSNLTAGHYFGAVIGRKTSNASTLLEVVHDKGSDLPKHSHERAFFSLLIEGEYSESYRGFDYSYRPMTLWWHPPNAVHKDKVGENGGHFFNIEIDIDWLTEYGDRTVLPRDFNTRADEMIVRVCRLFAEYRGWRPDSRLVADEETIELLRLANISGRRATERRPPWVPRIIERLNDEIDRDHSLAGLAADASVHPVHLATAFKAHLGQTIGEHLRQLRVSHALHRLICEETSLADIALSSGFCDQSHMTNVFKRYVGVTPGEYRRRTTGQKSSNGRT